jgi:uncharacterized membrane protein YcaP (DUF421 family)
MLPVLDKRILFNMNAFDFVVMVALRSTLPTILVSKDGSLAAGRTALGALIGLQFAVAWLSVLIASLGRIVKSELRLLVRDGQLLHGTMKAERVSEDEILVAIRGQGHTSLAQTHALVLKTDGSFSVLVKVPGEDTAALDAVDAR